MQICKLFLKILKKNIGLVVLYLVIFSVISTIFIFSGQKQEASYQQQKISTYVLVEEETEESKVFISFLEDYIKKVNLKNDSSVDDALFWDDIDLYIFVPKDFLDKVLNEEEAFTIKSAPDSLEAMSLLSTISSYLNTVKENIRLGITSREEALEYTKELFQNKEYLSVQIKQNDGTGYVRGFFDLSTYVISALMLMIIGLVSFEIRTIDISRRFRISSYSTVKRNVMLGLCYSGFVILFVFLLTGISACLLSSQINWKIWLYLGNLILFSITMVFMALFLSSLFKSDMAYSCVANVLPLVSAFICGAFVGIDLLPSATKAVGHIFPNIYIILGNQYIQSAAEFNFGTYLGIVWPCFLFIAIFIAGSILVTNFMARKEN
ncbi:ABC transporter permease [bacterium]|nr:ABC transporter permease [bacterium]